MQIELRNSDVLTFEGDGIIVPTISEGQMVEGVAARIRALVGPSIEEEVTKHAPIAVGAAFVTAAGPLPVKHLIHVPLAEAVGMRIGIENIRRATRAGLLGATKFGLERVAIPGMGYGELGVPHDEAARAMIDEALAYKGTHPSLVVFMDEDPDMWEALTEHTSSR
ncbi:MAG: macro domain-containing protein [Deltaproteobacteria bacterium]|nr:macro domain-containing protein [Deltaproteobacteria bacterium]